MFFHSYLFVLSFFLYSLLYHRLSRVFQNISLIIFGFIFYSLLDWRMSFLLVFCILFNFYAGLHLYQRKNQNSEKRIFASILLVNISILGFFKYFNFSVEIANDIFHFFHITPISVSKILLPIGISFYTFHNISYIMDIYYKKIHPTNNLLTFAIYDLFFPLLLAGPIERADKLIPQIESDRIVNSQDWNSGLNLFFLGLVKKIFVADHLSIFTDQAMTKGVILPEGISWWIAFAMAIQVYCDFSGYTDMARGISRTLGFRLSNNFLHPYFATNPVEFWRRWHISLSSWLRDYLYIPLGGNRVGKIREHINLLAVWIIGGLWHGATYGYLIWGLYCGVQVILYHNLENLIQKIFFLWIKNPNLQKMINFFKILSRPIGALGITISFGLGLMLFKIQNLDQIPYFLNFLKGFYWNPIFAGKICFLLFPIFLMEIYQTKSKDEELENLVFGRNILFTIYCMVLIQILLLLSINESKEFFYFQF